MRERGGTGASLGRAVAVLALFGAAGLALGLGRLGPPPPPPRPASFAGLDLPTPFVGAVEVPSVKAAGTALGTVLLLPHHCAARDDRAETIYVNASTGQLFARYRDVSSLGCPSFASGHLEVMQFQADDGAGAVPPSPAEVAAEMAEGAAAMGPSARLVTIDGTVGILVQGNYPGDCDLPGAGQEGCAPAQRNRAAVILQRGNTIVQLLGDPEWSGAQMVEIAESLA